MLDGWLVVAVVVAAVVHYSDSKTFALEKQLLAVGHIPILVAVVVAATVRHSGKFGLERKRKATATAAMFLQ